MTVTYVPTRHIKGDGNWYVGIEKVDSERRDPDPWGQGPILVYCVVDGVPPDKTYDTPGLLPTYMKVAGAPFVTNSALAKARRIADRLNSGDITIEELTRLLKEA